tara:strand:- start:195 stop:542 length:348 start_codon:yes stop_codon:yes gene_type:complete
MAEVKEKVRRSDSSTAEYDGRGIVSMTLDELTEAYDKVHDVMCELGTAQSQLEEAIDEAQRQMDEAEKLGIALDCELLADAWAVESAEAAASELADEIQCRIDDLEEEEEEEEEE